jgi:hypothetical protein
MLLKTFFNKKFLKKLICLLFLALFNNAIINLRIRNCICLNDNTKLLKYFYLNSGDTLITNFAAIFIFPFHLHLTHFYPVTSEVCGTWFLSSSIASSEKTITFYVFSGRATRLFLSGAGESIFPTERFTGHL